MPDYVVTNPGSGGAQIAADEISGTMYTRVKLTLGADGVASGDVNDALPMPVKLAPSASTGLAIFRSLDLDESEEQVKGSPGVVYGCWVTNTSSATRWLKFYNELATNVTVGSPPYPVLTIGIPGNSTDNISAVLGVGGHGIAFSTGITVAATVSPGDADATAPATGDVIVNIFYA